MSRLGRAGTLGLRLNSPATTTARIPTNLRVMAASMTVASVEVAHRPPAPSSRYPARGTSPSIESSAARSAVHMAANAGLASSVVSFLERCVPVRRPRSRRSVARFEVVKFDYDRQRCHRSFLHLAGRTALQDASTVLLDRCAGHGSELLERLCVVDPDVGDKVTLCHCSIPPLPRLLPAHGRGSAATPAEEPAGATRCSTRRSQPRRRIRPSCRHVATRWPSTSWNRARARARPCDVVSTRCSWWSHSSARARRWNQMA